jgi:hypothetical protein
MESGRDEVERSLYRLKREVLTAQIEKARRGDSKAASFVSTWVERSIEERRKTKNRSSDWHPELCPENAAIVRRLLLDPDSPQVPTAPVAVPEPSETAPRENTSARQAPEPIEEKPIVSFDPPRGEPFVHDGNGDAPRRVRRRGSLVSLVTPFDLGPPFS